MNVNLTLFEFIFPLLLFLLFGVLHSYAAKTSVKKLFRRRFPGLFNRYRLIYNIGSLLYLILFWWALSGKDQVIYAIQFPWILAAAFMICWGAWIAWRSFRHFDTLAFLGLRQINNPEEVNEFGEHDERLSISGWYRYVRHPLYFGSLLIIWFWPIMTVAWLQMAVYVTLYFVIGSKHEEKILVQRHGDSYRNYQMHTKRLIPFIY